MCITCRQAAPPFQGYAAPQAAWRPGQIPRRRAVSFTIYSMAMDTFVPMLDTLSTLLDKGAEHMKAQGAETRHACGGAACA